MLRCAQHDRAIFSHVHSAVHSVLPGVQQKIWDKLSLKGEGHIRFGHERNVDKLAH